MIPDATPAAPPRLAAWDVHVPKGTDDARAAVKAWLGHLAAGRLATPPPTRTPAQAERLARMEALLRPGPTPRIW